MVLTLGYWLWRFLTRLSQYFPLKVCYYLADLGGDIGYALWRTRRHAAKENIARVIGTTPEKPVVAALARQSFRHYGKYLVDFARMEALRYAELERRLPLVNWEAVSAAHSRGKGTILVGLHQGNWDLGLAVLAHRQYPMNVVVDELPHDRMNRMVVQSREQLGVNIIPMTQGVRPLIRALRENQMVGMLIDQPHATTGVRVHFLDHWVTVPAGAAALARKTGACLLPGGIIRHPGDTFEAILHDPIIPRNSDNRDADIRHLTQEIMTALEQIVREHPEQWYVFRPLWADEAA